MRNYWLSRDCFGYFLWTHKPELSTDSNGDPIIFQCFKDGMQFMYIGKRPFKNPYQQPLKIGELKKVEMAIKI